MTLAIELTPGIEDAWANVAEFVPKLLGFLVILVVGYVVVKAIAKIADKALERVGFDKAIERGGIGKAIEHTKYDPSDIVSKLVYWTLFLFVLQLAFGVFGANPVSDLVTSVIAYLPKVFVAVVIVVVAAAVAAGVKEIVQGALGGLSYGRGLAIAASTSIVVVGAFAALDQLDIAENIVTGLFYALLAIVAGSAIVAIGGGGIAPMRVRWERALTRLDDEAPKVREQLGQRADEVRGEAATTSTTPTRTQPLVADGRS
jgi:hypothetical protein